jgi:MraZ protein
MAMPSKYRQRLQDHCGGQLVVTIDSDSDPCLLVYPFPEWVEIEKRLSELPTLNKQARRLQRLLIGHATECELDGHGRILLPSLLRSFASIDKRVVLIGQGKKFELWNEQIWSERRDAWLADGKEDTQPLSTELESLSF